MMVRAFASANGDILEKGNFVNQDTMKRRPRARLGIAAVGILCLLALLAGCASSGSFPRGYRKLRADLQVWRNAAEGFSLTLITNPDRAQGFAEWGKLGIYGRVVGVTKSGDTMSISLGDGGMNGVELRITVRGNAIEARAALPRDAPAELQRQSSGASLVAERAAVPSAIRISAGALDEKQKSGRDVSIRLQYVTSTAAPERNVLDEALRRGKTVREAAIFRRAQQEESPVVIYQQSALEQSPGSDAIPAQGSGSAQPQPSQTGSAPPQPPLVYEEVQYPVFLSWHYISVATQRYLFNGGAHGAASTDFDVIDLAKGARLGPDDILREGWRKALLPALSAELLRQGSYAGANPKDGLKALGLFEPALSAPDKVFVCMNGLGFEYDRYQIAPWAMGEYIIVLPWDQVAAYLKDAIKPF